MNNFWKSLFGKTESVHDQSGPMAPGTKIRWDPHLVSKLKGEHQELLKIYQRLMLAVEKKNYKSIKGIIEEFRDGLLAHLADENARFYTYIRHQYQDDAERLEQITKFHREMGQIGKTVMEFVRKYLGVVLADGLAPSFKAELETIGGVLVKRIESEETILYKYYPTEDVIRRQAGAGH